jgi:catechol 2,3-dioxygenase-like lactoylglutathione lyase family enzyme
VIKTKGLRHINLNVTNLKRSLEFYRQVFGMQEMFRDAELVFLTTPGGDDTLTLCPAGANDPVAGGGVSHFGWTIEQGTDLDDAAQQIERAGGKVLRRGEHEPGHPFLYFTDPDGYVIEL